MPKRYKRYTPSNPIDHSNGLAFNVHCLMRTYNHLRSLPEPPNQSSPTLDDCRTFIAPLLLTLAIELALKSYLCRTSHSYPKTHDPLPLFDELPTHVQDYLNNEFQLHNPLSSNPISSLHHSNHFRWLLHYHKKLFDQWRYQPSFFDDHFRAEDPISPDKIYLAGLASAIGVLLSIDPSLLR